uniref:PAZ domain-containing protein n=1 Tax=Caenorhabditis tropicalis TaxID=1561998 RepID=A0A1I7UFR0_9PELO
MSTRAVNTRRSTRLSARLFTSNSTFQEAGTCKVQTNLFKVDISEMPARVVRLSMETTMCCGEERIKLSDLHTSGGLSATNRRIALRKIFRKVFYKNRDIFEGDMFMYSYDYATTIYAIEAAYKGGDTDVEVTLREGDFYDEEEWAQVSRIIGKPATQFNVVISRDGFVYSQGPEFESIQNRQKLIRLIEVLSSEIQKSPFSIQCSIRTYAIETEDTNEADDTAQILMELYKEIRWLDNKELAMLMDYKYSLFYKEISVLKLLTSKHEEVTRIFAPNQIPRDQGQRDLEQREQRAHREAEDPRDPQERRQSRSRSPHSPAPEQRAQEDPDYNVTKVIEAQAAFHNKRYPEVFKNIELSMKGITAKPTHLPEEYNHTVVITGFSDLNARQQKVFMNEDTNEQEEVTVFQYFERKHRHTIQFPLLPLIVTGSGERKAYFPMELLQIAPGQRIKAQNQSTALKSLMAEKNTILPRKYRKLIKNIWYSGWRLHNHLFLNYFGIKVLRKTVDSCAKMIHPPAVLFKDDKVCPMKIGTVQFAPLKGTQFRKPAKVKEIAVLNFDHAIEDPATLGTFCRNLHKMCINNGMNIPQQPHAWLQLFHESVREKLEETMSGLQRQNVSIIIGITKEETSITIPILLKYFEAILGIPTLQIHIGTANSFINMIEGDETVQNVIRKMNSKCGEINFMVEPPESVNGQPVCSNIADVRQRLFSETQFIGFETIHGSPWTLFNQNQRTVEGEPTTVGCAYSLELATDLGGFNYLQEMNEYKMKNVEGHIEECLNHYKTAVGRFPKTIVVFRTGTGEDDFNRVQEEVVDMKKVLEDKDIKLIVLLAQKTSHIRIFHAEITGEDACQQNVKSGTVIEDTITSPGRNDFILVSQTANSGTARPIRYTEVVNEPGWTKNELYHLTYFLAFGHQVSYQPPAVPNVVYAAENLAKRGRNNFVFHRKLGKLETTITDVLEEHEDPNDRELDGHILNEINNILNENALKRRNFWA